MYDVFICYNWDVKEWADALHAALVARGVQVFQDDKGIRFGDTLEPALREALLGARVLVPLMTPTFHESPSCRKELLTALTAAYRLEAGFTERIMPITWQVRPGAVPPRQLKRPKLLTREGHDVADQAAIIAAKVERIRATDQRRFGDAPPVGEPEWYPRALPANKRFRGRGELMWDVHESLLVKTKPGNRGHPVVSVRGDGGEGKTALCEQYARLFAEDHPGGVFVIRLGGSDRRGQLDRAAVLARFHHQLREIAGRLGVEAGSGGTEDLTAALGRRLHEAAAEVIGDSLEAARDRFGVTRAMSSRLPHVLTLTTTGEWPAGRGVWHALNESGRLQYELGDTAGSLYSFEILHRSCEASAEADEETRLRALVSLGAAHFGQGDYAKAAALQEEAVVRLRALVGPLHADMLQAEENLANSLGRLGAVEEALNLHRAVYRARCDVDGNTSRRTLIALNNLVLAVGRRGSWRLALRLALGAWARWQRAAGPDVPETLEAVEAVGHNLLRLGRAKDAAEVHDYVAERRRVVLGPDHPDTVDALENAATARGSTYWAAYAERLRVQDPAHVDTLETLLRLLRANLRVPRSAEAGEVVTLTDLVVEALDLAVALADQESAHGPEDPRALRANVVLAHALGAADEVIGDQLEAAAAVAQDARDGLGEAAARTPDAVEPFDLDIAEVVHHWLLGLLGEQPTY